MSSLVSIIISTYNSSPFIVETLESISRQSWKELELIVTDDCSVDNTVDICSTWLNKNFKRFVKSEILTSFKNTGIAANANRGLNVANGDWIKFIGADDTLKPSCIEDNMSWIINHPEIKALFSRIEVYRDTFNPGSLFKTIPDVPLDPDDILFPDRESDSQHKMLLICDRINYSPSVFLFRETLISVGGFDERFRMLEDYPLWLNLTGIGNKLYFMDKVTVNYRQHSKAINNTNFDYLVNPNYFKSEDFRKVYTYPYLPIAIRLNQYFNWYALQIFRSDWLNRNRKFNKFLLLLLTIILNPFRYYIFFKKLLVKDLTDREYYV